jgi:AcrR family transcriptional regulator
MYEMSRDTKTTAHAETEARTGDAADEAEARARDIAEQADLRGRESAERAEARAREAAERADEQARRAGEQAEEGALRAAERAAAAGERALAKTARAQDRAAQAMDRAAAAEARAGEQTARAVERAERAGGRGSRTAADEAASIWLRPEPNSRRPSHTRAEIAAAALAIADAEGFDAVSMRRVAQQLGAGTMTLYHYVRNKDELITLMFDAVMGEVLIPEEELTGGWRHAVERISISSREAFRRHDWALERLGDGRPGPNGMRHFEQSLTAIADLDLPPYEKFELIGLIDDYVFGYSLREAEELVEHERGWSQETLDFFQQQLDSGDYPLIRDFLGADVDVGIKRVIEYVSREGRFERGLERLLDGIEAHVALQGAENSSK